MINFYESVLFLFTFLLISCSNSEEQAPVLPQISIQDASFTESNTNQEVDIDVKLQGNHQTTVTVNYKTIAGTANSGSDFTEITQGQLTFNAGETQKSIQLTLKGDEEVESDETLEVLLFNPSGATLQRAKATITIKNDDIATLVIPSTGFSSPSSYAGYQLVWADEFQAASLNTAVWTHEIGNGSSGWGNNELEYYQGNNTSMAQNEYLVIEARKENKEGYNYTSSRIITRDKKSFKYGRIDIRAVLPKGKGIWPALWMLGSNIGTVGWPACGEIDIMEIIGSAPGKLHGTVHWDNNGQYASYGGDTTLSTGVFADEFHVFSITWDSQFIRWYLDDREFHVIDISPAALNEFQKDFFFIFNVAVGGNWPGSPDASTIFPQRMIVDYIRVFQKD
ncbi:MAG: family 16 glycosylhydrolase [Microscillaceae bacterium]|nr:family 16 glycosylhydrolase [Microscillaceae bacterium]